MEDVGYCRDPAQVAVYPDAALALRRLKSQGFRLIIVTNQSGIGRGYFTEEDYRRVQNEMSRQLGSRFFDAVYHCPDVPAHATDHRKPAPGMILEAAREHDLDLPRSYMVGDSDRDIEAGRRAGVAANVLVPTGKNGDPSHCRPDFTAANLTEAADWILQHAARHG